MKNSNHLAYEEYSNTSPINNQELEDALEKTNLMLESNLDKATAVLLVSSVSDKMQHGVLYLKARDLVVEPFDNVLKKTYRSFLGRYFQPQSVKKRISNKKRGVSIDKKINNYPGHLSEKHD